MPGPPTGRDLLVLYRVSCLSPQVLLGLARLHLAIDEQPTNDGEGEQQQLLHDIPQRWRRGRSLLVEPNLRARPVPPDAGAEETGAELDIRSVTPPIEVLRLAATLVRPDPVGSDVGAN